MDLNELFFRHQISVARAAQAASAEARFSHLGLARGYARRIDEVRSGDAPESVRSPNPNIATAPVILA